MSLFRNGGRTATVQLRGFSSSSSLRVGPESPNFIEVPRTVQPDLPSKPRVKEKINPDEPHAEYRERKREMADMRRQNLKEGLLELHKRKKWTDKKMEERSRQRQIQRERVLRQNERDDERYTRPSIVQDMLPKRTPVLPDPGREQRLAESRLRVENKKHQEELERQDSLHTLYMNAREFITTEAQLAAELEKVFPEGENEAWRSDYKYGENIWNLGFPRNLGTRPDVPKRESERWDVIQGRVKKLGEQITGGKI